MDYKIFILYKIFSIFAAIESLKEQISKFDQKKILQCIGFVSCDHKDCYSFRCAEICKDKNKNVINYLEEISLQSKTKKKTQKVTFLHYDSQIYWYHRTEKCDIKGKSLKAESYVIPIEKVDSSLKNIIQNKIKEIIPHCNPNSVSDIKKHLKEKFIDEKSVDDQKRESDINQKIQHGLNHLTYDEKEEILEFIQKIRSKPKVHGETNTQEKIVERETEQESLNLMKSDITGLPKETPGELERKTGDEKDLQMDEETTKEKLEIFHQETPQTEEVNISGSQTVNAVSFSQPKEVDCGNCQKLKAALDHLMEDVRTVAKSSLEKLLLQGALCDDVIHKYSCLIQDDSEKKCFIFDTNVFGTFKKKLEWNKFVEKSFCKEKKSYDFFAFPIHIKERFHWILIVYQESNSSFYCYDSLNTTQNIFIEIGKKCEEIILSILEKLSQKKYNKLPPLTSPPDICKQIQGSLDCGVFVLQWIKHLAFGKNTADVTPEKMVKYRQEMYDELVNNGMLYK